MVCFGELGHGLLEGLVFGLKGFNPGDEGVEKALEMLVLIVHMCIIAWRVVNFIYTPRLDTSAIVYTLLCWLGNGEYPQE